MRYSNEFKRECVRLYREERMTHSQVYEKVKDQLGSTSENGFRGQLGKWASIIDLSEPMLEASTMGYRNVPKNATVHTDAKGHIVQAWIRSSPEEDDLKEAENIFKNLKPIDKLKVDKEKRCDRLLEISLPDLHFGVGSLKIYKKVLLQVLEKINSKPWECIFIPFGGDLLHCNDFNGNTSSGTYLGEFDFGKAYADAVEFYRQIFVAAIDSGARVVCYYNQGNHSATASWTLLQGLMKLYPEIEYDDTYGKGNLLKAFTWHKIFIGITHGAKIKKSLADTERQFFKKFRMQFAKAKTIEIHKEHLHHEVGSEDINGSMVRILPSGVVKDDYHKEHGWIMSNERFTLFEYDHKNLKEIHYIDRE